MSNPKDVEICNLINENDKLEETIKAHEVTIAELQEENKQRQICFELLKTENLQLRNSPDSEV